MKLRKGLILISLSLLAIVLVAVYLLSFRDRDNSINDYGVTKIEVAEHNLDVYIADTNRKREVGLSAFDSISDDQGMLFVFDEPSIRSFWMRGMKFDIDIIWILDNKIVEITNNVPAQIGANENELIKYRSESEADKVLEVNAGWAKKNSLKVGDGSNVLD